jgi:RNA-directed DNA polymerase
VSEATQQAGEAQPPAGIRARWNWVEPAVWTERMLTALEQGVKGGKWFRLIDKVYALPNLRRAFARVKGNQGAAGVDHVTVEEFERDLEANLEKLSQALADSSYQPQAVRRHWITKLGSKERRPLGIPTVRDRVVQTALRAVLEPIFERDFAAQSYGFRPKRGCKDALRRVDTLLKQGNAWVVDADLKSYFDTIPRAELMGRVKNEDRRRTGAEAAGNVSDARGPGGNEPLDAGSGNAPGRGDQSVAVQYLSGCARPRDGGKGHRDGAVRR